MISEDLQQLIKKQDGSKVYWVCPYCLHLIELSHYQDIETCCEICGAEWQLFTLTPIAKGIDLKNCGADWSEKR